MSIRPRYLAYAYDCTIGTILPDSCFTKYGYVSLAFSTLGGLSIGQKKERIFYLKLYPYQRKKIINYVSGHTRGNFDTTTRCGNLIISHNEWVLHIKRNLYCKFKQFHVTRSHDRILGFWFKYFSYFMSCVCSGMILSFVLFSLKKYWEKNFKDIEDLVTRSTPPEDHKKSNYRNDSKLSSIICAKKILVLPFLILKTQIMKFQLEKYSNIGVNNRLMNWGYTYKYIYRKEILKIRDIPSIPVLYVCAGWLPPIITTKKM